MIEPEDTTGLCHWCKYTTTKPDLSIASNLLSWKKLELAKRRLLIQLEQLGLPPYTADVGKTYPLNFKFMGDEIDAEGNEKKIMTGHDDGEIVINIAEADSVHREQTRVLLGEPQRTLIGHMRHEVGHYVDWCMVQNIAPEEYKALFGDYNLDYQEALDLHYKNGAPADWYLNHVSAYATMHPNEDFAETFNVYLDLMAIATTAIDQGILNIDISADSKIQDDIQRILDIAIMASEFNSDMGLSPLLPEQLPQPVIDKLAFVHSLRSKKKVDSLKKFLEQSKANPAAIAEPVAPATIAVEETAAAST
jgi:hypothetical protein